MKKYYLALIGTRPDKNGELKVKGFRADDYEDLWTVLAEEVILPVIHEDYFSWLAAWAARYSHFRQSKRRHLIPVDPFTSCRPDELTTRQQLTVIKFFLYRRNFSAYAE